MILHSHSNLLQDYYLGIRENNTGNGTSLGNSPLFHISQDKLDGLAVGVKNNVWVGEQFESHGDFTTRNSHHFWFAIRTKHSYIIWSENDLRKPV